MSWDDIAAKLDRMGEHLKSLKEESDGFLNGEQNGVVNDFGSEPNHLIVKAFSNAPPPKRYGVLVGEILYHLRSCLDHMACQLTEDNKGICNRDVEFPIFTKSKGFGELGDPEAWNFKRIGQMDLAKQRLIEDEQPFKRKYGRMRDDPLLWLFELSNTDRHRFLHVVTASAREGFIEVEPAEAKSRLVEISTNFGPVVGDTEVMRFGILKGQQIDMHVHSNVRLDIAFSERPVPDKGVAFVLGSIGVRVGDLIQLLKP